MTPEIKVYRTDLKLGFSNNNLMFKEKQQVSQELQGTLNHLNHQDRQD